MFGARFDPDARVEPAAGHSVSDILHRAVQRKKRTRDGLRRAEENLKRTRDDMKRAAELNNTSSDSSDSSTEDSSDSSESSECETDSSKHQLPNDDTMEIDDAMEIDGSPSSKHRSVFEKLKRSTALQKNIIAPHPDVCEEIPAQALAPLPQPELPRDKKLASSNVAQNNLDWLAQPQFVPLNDTCAFNDLPLSTFMKNNLVKMNLSNAFAVQASVLRIMLGEISRNALQPDHGGDLLVNAATGLGKTLAYLIPIVEALHTRTVPRLRALILVPTRPLISQVMKTLADVARGTSLNIVSLRNDASLAEEGARLSRNTPDIVVGTPGRLVDHLSTGNLNVSHVRFLVIDEADRLLNQQFHNWCPELLSRLAPPANIAESWCVPVTKLIFSATLTTDAGRLAPLNITRPRLIVVNDRPEMVRELFSVPPTLHEHRLVRGLKQLPLKPLVLAKFLISRHIVLDVLVFCKSNEASLRLTRLLDLLLSRLQLDTSYKLDFLNSTNNKASVRARVLREFAVQKTSIVVATDLIARGIDVLSIKHVINYDLPNSAREYVHRVGRTARANQTGSACTLCFGKGEAKWFRGICQQVSRGPNQKISDVDPVESEVITARDREIYDECLEELQKGVYGDSK